jgi:hypothetical protein
MLQLRCADAVVTAASEAIAVYEGFADFSGVVATAR